MNSSYHPRKYRLIVFDWDGTLADSTAIIASSLQRACADLGLAVPNDRAARHVIGLGLADALRLVAPDLTPERHPELALRYRDHFLARDPEIPLFEGALELLQDLRAAGYALGIATGKTRRGLDRALGQQAIGHLFHHTRCADESPPKPDPDMLFCLAAAIGVDIQETLMIGDTSHDVLMARRAGAGIVAVSYGAHPAEELEAMADVPVVKSISELRDWLFSSA